MNNWFAVCHRPIGSTTPRFVLARRFPDSTSARVLLSLNLISTCRTNGALSAQTLQGSHYHQDFARIHLGTSLLRSVLAGKDRRGSRCANIPCWLILSYPPQWHSLDREHPSAIRPFECAPAGRRSSRYTSLAACGSVGNRPLALPVDPDPPGWTVVA